MLSSTLRRCDFGNEKNKREDDIDIDIDIDVDYVDFTKLKQPVVGTRLPVVPFLSNNGQTTSLVRCCSGELVGFDVVSRKHLVVCCVSPPLNIRYYYFQSVIDTYSDLPRDKFEVVLVASSDCEQANFDEFFSTLPCLAIPFTDVKTRHCICSFIGLSGPDDLSAILVDPEETVLQYQATFALFLLYGADWFPFHQSVADDIGNQDYVLRFRLDPFHKEFIKGVAAETALRDPLVDKPLCLYRDILLCDPNLAIPRIGSPDESLTVSELSNKYVGLYLYCEGRFGFLHDLIETYKECMEKKLDLEILIVYVPVLEHSCLYPPWEELVEGLKANKITSWLLFPKHNKVWRRLWRVFSLEYLEDRLIILPPNGRPGELEGRGIIEQLGITEYPYTRSSILERRFAALRSLTPATLFKGATKTRTCLVRKGKTFNVRQSSLKGKKLLVYLDWLQFKNDGGKVCRRLKELYPEIKARGWEVVFVPLDTELDLVLGRGNGKFPNMVWPVMPLRKTWEASVPDQLILEGEDGYRHLLVAFREDGKIVSREAMKGLMEHGLDDSLFDDKLYQEVAAHLLCFAG